MPNETKFHEILKKLIQEKGITQTALAEYLGIKPQTVSMYCSAKSYPEFHTIIKLASFFGVSIDYLVLGERPEHSQIRAELGLSEKALELLAYAAHSKENGLISVSKRINEILSDKEFYMFLNDNEEVIFEKVKEIQDLGNINEAGKYTSLIKIISEQTVINSANHMRNYFRIFYENLYGKDNDN